jgi:hypothetical protein
LASGWFQRQGLAGLLLLGVLALLHYGLSQAQNWEAILRLLGLDRKPPVSGSSPPSMNTSVAGGSTSQPAGHIPVVSSTSISAGGNLQIGGVQNHIHHTSNPSPSSPPSPAIPGLTTSPEHYAGRLYPKQASNEPSELMGNRQGGFISNEHATGHDEAIALKRLQIITELRDAGLLPHRDAEVLLYRCIDEIRITRIQQ